MTKEPDTWHRLVSFTGEPRKEKLKRWKLERELERLERKRDRKLTAGLMMVGHVREAEKH